MIDVTSLRKGVTFEVDGNLFKVLDYEHHKPGRGNAVIRIKARNMKTGATLEKTFLSGDRVQDVRLEFFEVQFLYHDSYFYYFMDQNTFEQYSVKADVLDDSINYLKETMEVKLTFYKGEPFEIELPINVDLVIVDAEIAVKGDTATGLTKKVITETGLEVQVPAFVNRGDTIRVDTRTGGYVTRV